MFEKLFDICVMIMLLVFGLQSNNSMGAASLAGAYFLLRLSQKTGKKTTRRTRQTVKPVKLPNRRQTAKAADKRLTDIEKSAQQADRRILDNRIRQSESHLRELRNEINELQKTRKKLMTPSERLASYYQGLGDVRNFGAKAR